MSFGRKVFYQLIRFLENPKMYVQYGSGLSGQDGWVNYDASPTLYFERIPIIGKLYTKNASRFSQNVMFGDIVKGLPVSKNSCSGLYCSHVLEHLSYVDCLEALKNSYKILKPEGIFRLVMPDIEYLARSYLASNDAEAATKFIRDTLMGQESRVASLRQFLIDYFGNNRHLWLWDYKAIEKRLIDVGFRDVRRAKFNDSSDGKFAEVENKERWKNCLGVECRK